VAQAQAPVGLPGSAGGASPNRAAWRGAGCLPLSMKAGGLSEFIAYELIDFTFFSNIFQMIVCFHMSNPPHTHL